jgi:hypothetical protein
MKAITTTQQENQQGNLELITANGNVLDPVKAIAEANRRVEFYKQIKNISLKMTNPHDWILEAGKPYLQGSGCEKLKPIWGIEIREPRIEPTLKEGIEIFRRDGEIAFECMVTGKSKVTGEESVFIGGRSSKDPFFSNQKSLDIVDVYKSAYTNAEVQAVMRLLGMRNLTVDDLKEAGIDPTKVNGVAFKGEAKAAAWDQKQSEHAKKVGEWLMEMNDGDKTLAADQLEQMTTFTGKDGREVKGKRSLKDLSAKQIDILYGKVEKTYADYLKMREEQ